MKVAFIGLGTMGAPMAKQLQESGHDVTGWDVTEIGRQRYSPCAASAREAIAGAEAIVTMLPNGDDVAEVYETLLFSNLSGGVLLIDCSTIDVGTTRALAKQAEEAEFPMLDAPVSGGAEAAGSGGLSFMVGGKKARSCALLPLLEAMGTKIMHFGEAGSGQAAKACHNMICGITALAVCEGFALAECGESNWIARSFSTCAVEPLRKLDFGEPLSGSRSCATGTQFERLCARIAARLMAKDLQLAQQAARATGQDTPLGKEVARRFAEFAKGPDADLDFSAIYKTIAKT